MNVLDILKDESSLTDFTARTKDECLKKLAEMLSKGVESIDQEKIYTCLKERENIGSTGFEDGIAIPHGKLSDIEDFALCIAVSKKGIDFGSLDGKKSHIFFALVGPEGKDKEHLQILAQISRISRISKARREMLQAPSPFVLKEVFTRFLSDVGVDTGAAGKRKLLMIILYEMKFLEDILDILLERGIRGATVIESRGIRDDLSTIPLFSSFFNFLGEKSDASKTIMVILKENELNLVVNQVEEIMGDLDAHTGAMVLALDIFHMKGTMEL
ncbi:PTS sugar transporter subunit IIA [Planctomycetota bacterium]